MNASAAKVHTSSMADEVQRLATCFAWRVNATSSAGVVASVPVFAAMARWAGVTALRSPCAMSSPHTSCPDGRVTEEGGAELVSMMEWHGQRKLTVEQVDVGVRVRAHRGGDSCRLSRAGILSNGEVHVRQGQRGAASTTRDSLASTGLNEKGPVRLTALQK